MWTPNALLRPVRERQLDIDTTCVAAIAWLEETLGVDAKIFHVGSTSLPALRTRGIVDILVRVPPGALRKTHSLLAELPQLDTRCAWRCHLEALGTPSPMLAMQTMLANSPVALGEYLALQRAHAHRPGRKYPAAQAEFFARFSENALEGIGEPHRLRIETERLVLVSPLAADAEEYAAYLADNREFFARNNVETKTPRLEFWQERFADDLCSRIVRKNLTLLVRARDARSTLIGSVHAFDVVLGPYKHCHIGYNLSESWQGKGYMSEAVVAALELLRTHWGLRRALATYLPKNTKSASLLHRVGFTVVGTLPEHREDRGGFAVFVLGSTSLEPPQDA